MLKLQMVAVGGGDDGVGARHQPVFALQADGDEFAVFEGKILRPAEREAEGLVRPRAHRLHRLFTVRHDLSCIFVSTVPTFDDAGGTQFLRATHLSQAT
jgi:hypothetical protein